jgi:DNA-binding transcriptional LysR family regulator
MREADVAIRMKEPSQADLIRKRLMSVKMRLYATHEYIEKFGEPKALPELKGHRLICQNTSSAQVAASSGFVQHLATYDPKMSLTVNNYFGVLQAVLSGLGVGVLPDYVTQDFPNLVRVLPEVESNEVPVYLAYPEELRQSKRIAAFRDFVTEEIFAHRKRLQDGGA